MSLKPEDIKRIVIEEDDFGHEMRVGNILANVKYPQIRFEDIYIEPPQHGGTYDDPVTGKPRQFDYRCQITAGRSRHIHLAIECKNLNPNSPLIVCGKPRSNGEDYHVFIETPEGQVSRIKKVEGYNSIYKPDQFVGKSLLRLKEKGNKTVVESDSDVYDRWSQALASSYELAQNAFRTNSKSASFVMPLVVIPNNTLWSVCYDDDGSISQEPIPSEACDFYVDRKFEVGLKNELNLKFVLTHIHFVTLDGLEKLLASFVNSRGRKWDEIFNISSTIFSAY